MCDTAVASLARSGRLKITAGAEDRIRLANAIDSAKNADPDRTLVAVVGRVLCATGYAALRDVRVEIRCGIVALSGRVPSYYQKQLAQATAQQVPGVGGIQNAIEVINSR